MVTEGDCFLFLFLFLFFFFYHQGYQRNFSSIIKFSVYTGLFDRDIVVLFHSYRPTIDYWSGISH